MNREKKIVYSLMAVGFAVGLAVLIAGIVMVKDQSAALSQFIDRQDQREAEALKKESEYIEDGAVIGEIYSIQSTSAISEAYLKKDPSTLGEEDRKTYELAGGILEKVTKDCKNVYEKEIKIYEWMCKNIKHDMNASTRAVLADGQYPLDTPYGVLNSKQAVCVGYATTFRLFMNMLGLECHVPHSDSHSWDLVKLEDDQWYYVDVYSASSWGSVNYEYFNMDESAALEREDMSQVTGLPAANGKKYLYAVNMAQKADDIYQVPKLIKKALKKKKNMVSVCLEKKPTEDEIGLAGSMIDAITYRIPVNMEKYANVMFSYSWYRDEEKNYVLAIYMTKDTSMTSLDGDSKQVKKMEKAISKEFGEGDGSDVLSGSVLGNSEKVVSDTGAASVNSAG